MKILFSSIVLFMTIQFQCYNCGLIKEYLENRSAARNRGLPGLNFNFGISLGLGDKQQQQQQPQPPHGGPPGLGHQHHHHHPHENSNNFDRFEQHPHGGPPGLNKPHHQGPPDRFQNQGNSNQNYPDRYPNQGNPNQNPPDRYPNEGNPNQNPPDRYPNQGNPNQNPPDRYPNQGNPNQNYPDRYPNQGNPNQNLPDEYPNQGNPNQNPPDRFPLPIPSVSPIPNEVDGIVHITPKQPSGTTPRPARSTTQKLDYDFDVRLGDGNNGVVLDTSKFHPAGTTTQKSLQNDRIVFMEEEKRRKREAFNFFESPFSPKENLSFNRFRYNDCEPSERCVPIDNCPHKKQPEKRNYCRSSLAVPSVCCNKNPIRKSRRPSLFSRDLNNVQECGVVYEKPQKLGPQALALAVGAIPVKSLTNAPWMVAIGEIRGRKDVQYMCGGSLISDRVVLTAAHCLDGNPNFVRLGELDFSTDDEKSAPVNIKIERRIQYPDYKKGVVYNDIGLIILEQPVIFNKYIRPICLPSIIDNDYTGEVLYFAGWGPDRRGGRPSSILRYATVEIFNNTYCNEIFDSANINRGNLPKGIISTQICAGDKNVEKDACEGDSGGPLGLKRDDETRIVIGIISSGIGCGYKNFPGVYTRVYSYVPWIEQYL